LNLQIPCGYAHPCHLSLADHENHSSGANIHPTIRYI
jgi:hypothetical protein